MIRRLVFLLPAFVAATTGIAGLFSSTPSESEAEKYWKGQFAKSNGLLELNSFKKTDGKDTPDGYTLYYELSYNVIENCLYDATSFRAVKGLEHASTNQLPAFVGDQTQGYRGQRFIVSGEMWYEKRESGWVLNHVLKTSVQETPESLKRAAVERQEQANREQRQRDDRNALVAKAKERHKVILRASWNNPNDPSQVRYCALSDCDIEIGGSFQGYPDKPGIAWFGDIRRVNPVASGSEFYLEINPPTGSGTGYGTCAFHNAEEMQRFFETYKQTYNQWRKDNDVLFQQQSPR